MGNSMSAKNFGLPCSNSISPNGYNLTGGGEGKIIERRFSYSMLAKLMGLSMVNISRKMRNERNFTAKDIAKLVEIFGLPAEYLMAREDE